MICTVYVLLHQLYTSRRALLNYVTAYTCACVSASSTHFLVHLLVPHSFSVADVVRQLDESENEEINELIDAVNYSYPCKFCLAIFWKESTEGAVVFAISTFKIKTTTFD